MKEMKLWSLGWEDPLEKPMATHSNILAWKIPWTEKPGGLQSIGLQIVRHDLATKQQQSYIRVCVCLHACSVVKSRLTLCYSMDYCPPGSSVPGISQARILEWVAIPLCRGSSWPRDRDPISCITGRFFTTWATREAHVCVYTYKQTYYYGLNCVTPRLILKS